MTNKPAERVNNNNDGMSSSSSTVQESILDKVSERTDIAAFSRAKKKQLFAEAVTRLKTHKGAIGESLKHVITNMKRAHEEECRLNQEMNRRNEELEQQIKQLTEENKRLQSAKSNQLPGYNPTWGSSRVTREEKKEYLVIVESTSKEANIDLNELIDDKLESVAERITITNTKIRNEKLIINLQDEQQQKLVEEKLKNDAQINCRLPSKKIASIIIKDVSRKMSDDSLLNKIKANGDLKHPERATIIKRITNVKYKTDRIKINFDREDTTTIIRANEIKIGARIHQIEVDYGLIQCRNCGKFGHFHKDKEGKNITCRSKKKHCSHCDQDHHIGDCQVSSQRSRAKCTNCGGNHRHYDDRCPKKIEALNRVKQRFEC